MSYFWFLTIFCAGVVITSFLAGLKASLLIRIDWLEVFAPFNAAVLVVAVPYIYTVLTWPRG